MNKVMLCGRLTAKPNLRCIESNKNYARFTIAVNRPKQEDKEQEADFINCISWGKQAETIAKYFDKGSQIVVNGRIRVDNYTDKDGNKKTNTDVVIEEFDFIGGKKEETKEEVKETKKEESHDPFEDFGNNIDNYLE